MRLSRPTLAALLLLALSAAPVLAGPPARADAARAEHERVVRFWTPARMAAAIPRDRALSGEAALSPNNNGKGKPGGGGGDGGDTSTTNVTGAGWGNKGGTVRTAVGKVFFKLSGTLYTCSGSVANDSRSTYSLVLTAAHCAFDETGDVFATDWLFIPDYEASPTRTCNNTKYGCWTASALVIHKGYKDATGFNSQATVHDFAFAVVGGGGKSGESKQLDTTVGSFPITFNQFAEGTRMYAFGYPAAGKYKGNKLIYCAGPIFYDSWNDNQTYGLACDMTGGSSGGPWFTNFNESTGSGTLSSLNSYGYSSLKGYMFGPKFNDNTADVYNSADGATSDTIVP
ncbi:MAG: trypsin-like peptidase domain-containing protein [Chloroflexota bacterium]|nr:trypsin-like peptidase domain-containing protein [Chloroflexota bacterium]